MARFLEGNTVGVILITTQGVEHGVQQAANHGISSRLRSQTNQGALRVGSEEDAFVVRRLVNAGRRVPRVLH